MEPKSVVQLGSLPGAVGSPVQRCGVERLRIGAAEQQRALAGLAAAQPVIEDQITQHPGHWHHPSRVAGLGLDPSSLRVPRGTDFD